MSIVVAVLDKITFLTKKKINEYKKKENKQRIREK
jgi:hypothetical protein